MARWWLSVPSAAIHPPVIQLVVPRATLAATIAKQAASKEHRQLFRKQGGQERRDDMQRQNEQKYQRRTRALPSSRLTSLALLLSWLLHRISAPVIR
jgi:hypothetical protein